MKELLRRLELTHQETSLLLIAAEDHINAIGSELFTQELTKGKDALESNLDARLVLLAGSQMLVSYLAKDEKIARWSMTELADRFKTVSEDTLRAEISAGQDTLDRLNLTTPALTYHLGRSILAGIIAKYAIQIVAARN